jgi:copper transport protein
VNPTRPKGSSLTGLIVAAALVVLLVMPAIASAHAILIASDPPMHAVTATAPAVVRLEFSEPVTLLNPAQDCQVVGSTGASIESGPCHVSPTDVRELDAPLDPHVAPGTYTVRYQVVSADSHVVGAALPFAIGHGPVGLPYLGNRPGQGPTETSSWEVSARALEFVGLGGLLAVIAFRWLVWAPVWRPGTRQEHLPDARRQAALEWGRDLYWTVFGILAIGAMLAEGYLLVVYSATVLGTSVIHAAGDTSGIGTVLSSTRFGSLIQYRGALLFVLFAVGAWQYLAEFGSGAPPRPATAAGRPIPGAIMAVAIVGVLWGIASQGHASQAPVPVVQELADVVHLGSAAVWVGGLALTILVLWRAPRALPDAGSALATDVLVRFSRVALAAVGAIVATGIIRTFGELSSPEQLWSTSYGVTILVKVGLLAIAGIVALRNRRITQTLAHRSAPHRGALASVRNAATAELVLGIAILVAAALLVAEVPGRIG